MIQTMGRWTGALLVALLLFGELAESLPLFHDHEEEHLCIQIDDRFYYGESDHSLHNVENPSETAVINLVLGESHEHHICALCQLASSYTVSDAKSFAFLQPEDPKVNFGLQSSPYSVSYLIQARGPPTV